MSSFTSRLIDALGGTTEVARHMEASISTVHRMRTEATPSRLNHLRRVAHMECPNLDLAALAALADAADGQTQKHAGTPVTSTEIAA